MVLVVALLANFRKVRHCKTAVLVNVSQGTVKHVYKHINKKCVRACHQQQQGHKDKHGLTVLQANLIPARQRYFFAILKHKGTKRE